RRTLLRRHHQRVRRHARLRAADRRRRSVGDRGVHSRAPAQRARHARRRSGRRAGQDPLMPPLTQTADAAIPELAHHQRTLLLAGAAGAVVSLGGAFLNFTQFMQSYLMAYMLCLGVTLGSLALGMMHQLSGGAWGVVIRRQIGAAARVLPVMTLLFVPI